MLTGKEVSHPAPKERGQKERNKWRGEGAPAASGGGRGKTMH